MKILFLDFGGVLTDNEVQIDNHKVKLVNDIVRQTGCKIVLTTSWANNNTLSELKGYLSGHALTYYAIIGRVPTKKELGGKHVTKGNQVQAWLETNKDKLGCKIRSYHSYAILDDESDFLYWHRNNLLICSTPSGLTEIMAERVIQKLRYSSELRKFPYTCIDRQSGKSFIPTMVDYKNKMVWEQKGQASGNGEWIHFQDLKITKNKFFEL